MRRWLGRRHAGRALEQGGVHTFSVVAPVRGFGIGSGITDKGMTEFGKILATGALASCRGLYLSNNQIGDAGLEALSGALATGALPSLRILFIDSPSEQLKAHCSSKNIKLNTF